MGSHRQTEHTEQLSQSIGHWANPPAPQKPCQIRCQLKLQATVCRRACRRPCCHPCPGGSHGQLAPRLTFPALSSPVRVPAKLWGTVGCSCMPGCTHTHTGMLLPVLHKHAEQLNSCMLQDAEPFGNTSGAIGTTSTSSPWSGMSSAEEWDGAWGFGE